MPTHRPPVVVDDVSHRMSWFTVVGAAVGGTVDDVFVALAVVVEATVAEGVVEVARVAGDAPDVVAARLALVVGATAPFDVLHADAKTSATTTITRRIGCLPSDSPAW